MPGRALGDPHHREGRSKPEAKAGKRIRFARLIAPYSPEVTASERPNLIGPANLFGRATPTCLRFGTLSKVSLIIPPDYWLPNVSNEVMRLRDVHFLTHLCRSARQRVKYLARGELIPAILPEMHDQRLARSVHFKSSNRIQESQGRGFRAVPDRTLTTPGKDSCYSVTLDPGSSMTHGC